MASDLLSTIGEEIDARLRELRPVFAEYERLLVAVEALDVEAVSEPAAPAQSPAPAIADLAAPPAAKRRAAPAAKGRKAAPRATVTRARGRARTKAPSRRSETEETILGILEHGSHTVAELVVVTAMKTASINSSLRRLRADGAIAKTEREGKVAWQLAGATA